MINKSFSIALCLLFFLSCQTPTVDYIDITGEDWYRENPVFFTVKESIINEENTKLVIRHTDEYPFQNLWVKMACYPPNSPYKLTRTEFQLAQPDGHWLGKKSGAIYTIELPLSDLECPADTCIVQVSQNMRANPLVGIQSVGLGF